MTLDSLLSVIFTFQADTCDGDGTEIYLVPHALHAVIADFVWLQIAAVAFTTAVAELPVI